MSDAESRDAFNLERLQQLVELMEEHALSEIDLQQNHQRIRLRRGAIGEVQVAATQATAPVAARTDSPTDVGVENTVTINSPMVGTFYTRPNPEADAFIKVGDHINADTIVCVVEAMKVFNEIPADVSGQIVAVLVENEESVEFGKPLFKVDTSK
jgi:acetyl-CoA carboxylase biotin carboxyl carrier protein